MTETASLPEIVQEQISNLVKVHRMKDHLTVSFSYGTPGRAVFLENLLFLIVFIFVLCFVSDFIHGYASGGSFAHNNLAERYIPWVYQVYSLPKYPIMVAFFGDPDYRLDKFAATFVSLGAMTVWAILGVIVKNIELIPRLSSALFPKRETIKFFPDHVVLHGQQFPYSDDQQFELEETVRVRNRVRHHNFDARSREITFVNGVNRITVAVVFGADRARLIQNTLHHILGHFPWDDR